jgi:hypothetical protein
MSRSSLHRARVLKATGPTCTMLFVVGFLSTVVYFFVAVVPLCR